MATFSQKIQYSTNFFDGGIPVSGYINETGNSKIDVVQSFAASTTNGPFSLSFTLANLQSLVLISDKGCTLKTNSGTGAADVQTIAITGTPTGGSFSVVFGGQSTVIAYNAAAATVQSALQAMTSIGSGNLTCTGGPLPGTAVVCTFAGTKATGKRDLMTAFSGGLTGGTTPTVTVSKTTNGTPSDTLVLLPGVPKAWYKSSGDACFFTSDVSSAFVTTTTAGTLTAKGLQS
jgi:hypothetical protein